MLNGLRKLVKGASLSDSGDVTTRSIPRGLGTNIGPTPTDILFDN